MASHMATQPRPSSYAGASRPPTASRFVEGSMNDRSSNAPPPLMFLGGSGSGSNFGNFGSSSSAGVIDNLYADARKRSHEGTILQRFSLQATRPPPTTSTAAPMATTATTATTSSTTSTSSSRRPRSFLAPFWDGVARRLHRRTRSTVEAGDRVDGQDDNRQQPQNPLHTENEIPMGGHGVLSGFAAAGDRPSPEDVLANYHKLVEDGFFSKRAIPATRQGLTSSSGGGGGAALPPVMPPLAAAAPRGTKRGRADADEEEDEDEDEDEARETMNAAKVPAMTSTAGSAPVTRSPRKLVKKPSKKKIRKSANRLEEQGGRNKLRRQPAPRDDGSLSSRCSSTRSRTSASRAQVHQPLPPLPAVASMPAPVPETVAVPDERRPESASRKRKAPTDQEEAEQRQHTRGPSERSERSERRREHRSDHRRHEAAEEPRKKRRSAGPAVVHQDEGDGSYQQRRQERRQKAHTSLDASSECTTAAKTEASPRRKRDGHSSRSSSHRAPLGALSPSAPPQQQHQQHQHQPRAPSPPLPQLPISFHYPQRVRVRRPQVVEVKASSGKKRSSRHDAGKSLLFRDVEAEAENMAPAWDS